MSRKRIKQKKQQAIKIDGFRFPHQLLEELRQFQDQQHIQVPASSYAVLLTVLQQIYVERNSQGKVLEYNLAHWARKLHMAYSTMHAGREFLIRHGFLYEEILPSGMPAFVLRNYKEYTTPELVKGHELNYFIVPHTLFQTNIIAELVRTANPEAFELLFSLLNQFRHGVAKLRNTGELSFVEQTRNMGTLKEKLGKRSKAIREMLTLFEAIFEIELVGVQVRGKQLWVRQVKFRLKEECVKENTDEFEVQPLLAAFQENSLYVLDGLKLRYKARDLFDIMISFKQEVVNVVKYIINEERDQSYSYRDSWLETFFYSCLSRFEQHMKEQKESFTFRTSIGAYFRTIFRRNLPHAVRQIPYPLVHDAKVLEYTSKEQIPKLHLLTV